MTTIVPEPPPAKRRNERRRFVPRLSDDPDTRSIQVGIVATLIVHLLLVVLIPKHLGSDVTGKFKPRQHPIDQQFNIQLTPEEVRQPKPPQPKNYVETNPNAPSNTPDKTNNFAAQNQQAAQPKPSKHPTGDRPDRVSDKKVISNQVVSGQLIKPQPLVLAPPPEPKIKVNQAVKKQAAREQNPLPGVDKLVGEDQNGIGTNIAKASTNPRDVPKQVKGTPDAPLIEGVLGPITIDPRHPMPRPHLDQIRTRPAVFQDNKFGTSNIGLAAIDARWSAWGQYLRELTETVQVQWDKLLMDAKTYPAQGSSVSVTFILKSDGTIGNIVNVQSDTAGRQGKDYCVAAITLPAPYDKWSKDMIATLGDQQQMTFVFYYQ
ncbi:hypothetical protein GALL_105540 [mine drainage metagenome]|uniref:Uncharacterized protein n=1 Tax=mine drainage metagenome TaxID=410659 RepID=A0A1J5SG05_9ZZZZ